jgi:aspartate aminotransferase-like enzyme
VYKKLFTPGPTNIKEDVLKKMATLMISHRTKEASKLQKDISNKMRKLMYTKNEILLSTSSACGLMEGALRSCTQKRAAVFSCGVFGNQWYQMAITNNIPCDKFEVEWGKPITKEIVKSALATGKYDLIAITHNETSTGVMNPIEEIAEVVKNYPKVVFCLDTVSSLGGVKIEVDKLGVDICLASTQKCLALPPGFSVCSISEKAIEAAKKVKFRGSYFDLLRLYNWVKEKDYQYPSTPSLPHMFALDYQLDKIFKEGLENRFSRHIEVANHVRNWVKNNFALFAEEKYTSNTVTCVKNIRGIDVNELNKALGEKGYIISNGLENIKDKTFRIGHMGESTLSDLKELLSVIKGILKL